MKKYLHIIVFAVIGMATVSASAQTMTAVPYSMGFEDNEAAEWANWVINPGSAAANCTDQWVKGNAVHSSGTQSLYISTDSAQTARFGTKPDLQFAYRDFLLPQGRYDVSFDWCCVGAANASLNAGYGYTSLNLAANAASGTIPTAVNAYVNKSAKDLKGSDTWQNASFQMTSDGVTPIRLFFAWSNNNKDSVANPIGGCVDNIQITSTNCKRPSNMAGSVVSCDSVRVTWSGTSAEYEFAYRAVGSDYWHRVTGIQGGVTGEVYLTNMTEGSYDFRVRGICAPDTSAWTYESGFVVFCPEMHCVNFTDLYAPTVTCTYGTTNSGGYAQTKQLAYENVGVIDFGPDSKQSRHTVNWDKAATDPRTGGNLPLIPKGGYASVRLGNWDYNYGAESVSYQYTVDSTNAILLMNYAIVLECPSGHDDDAMPRFLLEVLDSTGHILDPTCGVRDFFAKEAREGWEEYYDPSAGYYSEPVVYKPWTTVGLNLIDMGLNPGDKIQVRLTTYDCFWSAHYGYAYFTLDCASATIETTSCAKDTVMAMTLTAPDGFKYQWYDRFDQPIIGATGRVFEPTDTATYRCHITSTENPNCYFDLYSQCLPRIPMPRFVCNYAPKDCKNMVEIANNSYIRAFQRNDTLEMYDKKCDEYLWETWGANMQLTTSDRENPTFTYPAEGGTFFVKLTASLNGSCTSDSVQQITIPAIQDTYEAFDTVLCQGDWIQWGEQVIAESGVYPLYLKSKAGCDSTRVMTVTVNPVYVIKLDTTDICYGEDHMIGDDKFHGIKSGMHMVRLTSSTGCDSTIMQYVVVHDEIKPELRVDGIDLEQKKFTADIYVSGTGFIGYILRSNSDPVGQKHEPADDLHGLGINVYYLEFYNEFGCTKTDTVLIGGACLQVTLGEQQTCESSMPVIILPYKTDSGIVTNYSVDFDAAAEAAGFEDIAMTRVTDVAKIVVDIPAAVEPNLYHADLIFEDLVCGNDTFPVTLTVTYPGSVLYTRWKDVISLMNNDYAQYMATPYAFDSYQWYVNGQEIAGANLSYYSPYPQELDMLGQYQLKMKRSDGIEFLTCPCVPGTVENAAPASVRVAPTRVPAGHPVTVTVGEAGMMDVYSAMGQKVMSVALEENDNVVVMPAQEGIYILSVRTREHQENVRVYVQ